MAAKKMADRPRLGRGLAALLGDGGDQGTGQEAPSRRAGRIASIAIDMLEPGPFQPRQTIDPENLDELADSIRRQGVLQPILVRSHPERPGHYQIIGGERRWRASQKAQLHEVPAHILELSDSDAMAAALVENLQRADLNPIEEAEGFSRLMEDHSLTQDDLAGLIGKSRPHVANTLRLLRLPDTLRREVSRGRLTAGHARALLTHPEPVRAAREVIEKELSVRQTELLVQKATGGKRASSRVAEVKRDPELQSLERDLTSRLGMKVEVTFDGKKGGTIRFDYKSLEQLDGLLALLKR